MSGSGDVTYLTSGTPEAVTQTLSARTVDFSVPASYRIAPWGAVYGGPIGLLSNVSGSIGSAVGSDSFTDLGVNLGTQITSGIFTGDLEFAELMVEDPFTGSRRFVPYLGLSFGVLF